MCLYFHSGFNKAANICGECPFLKTNKTCSQISDCYEGKYYKAFQDQDDLSAFCYRKSGLCCLDLSEGSFCDGQQGIVMLNEENCVEEGKTCTNSHQNTGVCKKFKEGLYNKPIFRCCPGLIEDFVSRTQCDENQILPITILEAYCKGGFVVAAGKKTLDAKNANKTCNINSDCGPNRYCIRLKIDEDSKCYDISLKKVENSEDDAEGLSLTMIIIIVAVGVAVVVLIAGAVAFYCYRKKKAAKNLGNNAHGKKTMSTSNSNDKLSAKSPTAKPSPNGWLAKNPFV
ncbi:unnamed protein product [Caenorhabditis angaria]|uniref:Uncharacterized protein n=1 Tax=Caenorhabditis angaria TaxID=860376 RepID=A0A9P1N1V2_9PELO|nr:unnamed protein product [Caenorhabditis angaria]